MMRRLLVGVTGVAAAVLVALTTQGHTFDFGLDWLVARALLSGLDPHAPLHVLGDYFGVTVEHGGVLPHPRTPAALLLQAPVGWIPMEYGYQAGRVLTVGSFAGLMWVVSRIARVPLHWLLAAMPVLLFVWPFSVVLDFSQTSFMVAALIGLAWLMGDRLSAGVPLAVAVAFKMWPWLLVPALWVSGRRKTAYGAAVGFAGLNLVGLALPNITVSSAWEAMSGARAVESWSLVGADVVVWAAAGLLAVVIIRRFASPTATVMWSVPVALAVAPVLWPHYFVALAFPLAVVAGRFSGVESEDTVEVSRLIPFGACVS